VNEAASTPGMIKGVRPGLAARTAAVEEIIRRELPEIFRSPSGAALAAVGGFGRGELFLHSDIDLMLIADSEREIACAKEPWAQFLQTLWDRGLRPSHAVHTVAECAAEHEGNLELTITLLDRRFLAGDAQVFAALDSRFRAFAAKRRVSLMKRLIEAAEARRAKFQNTIYHLEPDVKNAPGALRDLQTVRWLYALHEAGDAPDLTAAFDALAWLRASLHQISGRDRNILHFEAQEALGENPAALMRNYYRHARTVDRALSKAVETAPARENGMLGRFYDWRSRLSTAEYTVLRDRVWLRDAALPRDLGVFEFAARHELKLAPDTIERLRGAPIEPDWEDWKRLLSLAHASAGLRAMQQADLLASAIPEWANIDCLVVRDFYHRYTVDEHTLVAIGALESPGDARFGELAAEIPDMHLVRFAILLHDIGKGTGRDHVEESMNIARDVLARLDAAERDRATVEFLIAHHLDLSGVMTTRDLHDRETAKALAARVETIERLKQLTILTYADISAVNPEAMTPWRAEQLWQTYLLAAAELTSELYSERIHGAPADPEMAAFLEGLPVRYIRTHSEAEIQRHFELSKQVDAGAVIEIARGEKIYRLTLLARDQPGLFASVAGAIAAFGLSVVKAEAFSNAWGVAVDTFTFSDPHRTLELNPSEVDRLRRTARRVIEGKESVAELLRARPKPGRKGKLRPSITFDGAPSAATLIEIVAEDRPGLLYDLSRAISAAQCNIEVVLIDTQGHKALDVFYVTAGGKKLRQDVAEKLRAALLGVA
jgi:[protein-PII] uridylyltransferase